MRPKKGNNLANLEARLVRNSKYNLCRYYSFKMKSLCLYDLKCKFDFYWCDVLTKEEREQSSSCSNQCLLPKTDFCTSVTNQVFAILTFSNSKQTNSQTQLIVKFAKFTSVPMSKTKCTKS